MKIKELFSPSFIASHIALVILLVIVTTMPGIAETKDPVWFCIAIVLIEVLFLANQIKSLAKASKSRKKGLFNRYAGEVICFLWIVLIVWDLVTAKFKLVGTVLFPPPEDVFYVYAANWQEMLINAGYSTGILVVGFSIGTALGIFLGLFVGWNPRLKSFFFPIARIMAPIPPMVYAPYVVILLPAFELTSVTLIALAIFLCVFLSTIISVSQVNEHTIDSARTLGVSGSKMVLEILLPSALPAYVDSLKVNVIIAFMMLVFSETVGANFGMGHWIHLFTHYGDYAKTFAGIFEMAAVVLIVNVIVEKIQAKAIKWKAD
jgi:NitT/TauT family transport system permease protein